MIPLYTITKDVSVGIWDNEQYVARIYKDKVIVVTPYVKWVNNSGSLAYSKQSIRDQKIVDNVIAEIKDDCEKSAWSLIGRAIDDDHLINCVF